MGESHPRGRAQRQDASLVTRPALRKIFERPLARARRKRKDRGLGGGGFARRQALRGSRAAHVSRRLAHSQAGCRVRNAGALRRSRLGAIDYQFISVPTHFTEDKWVQMVEVRPGEPAVVHHAIVVALDPSNRAHEEYLGGYSPGMTPQMWKPGQARLVKAGATLVFQMHYAANGKPARDRTRIGLIFARAPVTEQITGVQVMPSGLNIPPDAADYRVEASDIMRQNVKLVGMRPHMHLRGKSFEFRAVYPTAKPKRCFASRSSISTGSPTITWKRPRFFRAARASSARPTSTTRPTIRLIPIPPRGFLGTAELGRDDDRLDGHRRRTAA